MNYKILLAGITVLTTIGAKLQTSTSFNYTYQIITNSYSLNDEVQGYYYKERLIDEYEALAFHNEERKHQEIIMANIDRFKFDDNCYPYYYNGGIFVIIGNGQGMSIKGHLRKNECDESVIREKIYIFDLFK